MANAAQKPTTEDLQVLGFYKEAQRVMCNLYGRWQSEKAYEAIADYAAPLADLAKKHNLPAPTMTKRPFGCKFALGGRVYSVTVTARQYKMTYRVA